VVTRAAGVLAASGRGPRPRSALKLNTNTDAPFTPKQRLLVLDSWRRSGLHDGDFALLEGVPKSLFHLTGQAGGQPFSVHSEGERVILTRGDGRQEIDLLPPRPAPEVTPPALPVPVCPNGVASTTGDRFKAPPAPGGSNLDDWFHHLSEPPPSEASTNRRTPQPPGRQLDLAAHLDASRPCPRSQGVTNCAEGEGVDGTPCQTRTHTRVPLPKAF